MIRTVLGVLLLIVSSGLSGCAAVTEPFGLEDPFAIQRPFAGVARNDEMLTPAFDVSTLIVEVPQGLKPEFGLVMRDRLIRDLQERDIPALAATTMTAWKLKARADKVVTNERKGGVTRVVLVWRLYNAEGTQQAQFTVEFKGEDAATVEPRLGDIVQKTADQTEQTLRPLAPKSGSRTIAGVPIVFIGDIKGAPGDGNSSLAIGLRTALPQRGISVKETSADAGWRIECAVNVTSKSKTEDTVTLKWRVLDKSGVEKGSMTQENAVPRGRLDKEWGEIAGFATEAASEGIQSIIQQVAKPPTE